MRADAGAVKEFRDPVNFSLVNLFLENYYCIIKVSSLD